MSYKLLTKGNFGIEREGVRVDSTGKISLTKHPKIFNESNPYITRDFAEAQIEMITEPCPTIEESENMLLDIQSVVLQGLENEYLWKQSTPPILDDNIQVAEFESDPHKDEYRKYLSSRYGKEKSIISGVHFNFSFDESVLDFLFKKSNEFDYIAFKNNLYLKVSKYILKNRWFFIYLTNASPVFHKSYYQHCVNNSIQLETGDCYIDGMRSIRNSTCGYRNEDELILDYTSLENYKRRVKEIIEDGKISQESELYTPVRLKLDTKGNIQYIEIRFLDINPFTESGISVLDLKYLHMFIIKSALMNDFDFNEEQQREANNKQDEVTRTTECQCVNLKEMIAIHTDIVEFEKNKELYSNSKDIFESILQRIENPKKTYSELLKEEYIKSSYIEYHLIQAKQITNETLKKPFKFRMNDKLELSTKILILEAIRQGYKFDVLDEMTNFISLTDPLTGQIEYIQQATKTNLDKYANVLAMENKIVTKKILNAHNVRVPKGDVITDVTNLDFVSLDKYKDTGIVIKPNTTNFGEGITIYTHNVDVENVRNAIEFAFTKDNTVLLEEFITGKEYRFLIINGEVVGVLHRRAANVVGNGKQTVKELIKEKNLHPYRGNNYVTPLEKIKMGVLEKEFIELQGIDENTILKKDEILFLRENSNISTGGDSIDVTDIVHPSYKMIAETASQALGVNISGVDIIIKDIKDEADEDNYCILELNFNPAIHIHTYPLEGKNRYPGKKIIKALFKKETKNTNEKYN